MGLSDPTLGLTMLGLFLVFIMLGFPIAFTLMAMGLFFGYAGTLGDRVLELLVQRTFAVMANDVLLAVPLFVFMGYIIERANILDRLFRALQLASRNLPGSLGVATLVTCAMFATATGIVGAVVTLMGLLAFPAMLRAGYDVRLASGIVCAGGCLGILIPPSVMLILFGATAGVSVVKLYAAAFFPGLLLASLYVLYAIGVAVVRPHWAPRLPAEVAATPLLQVLAELLTSFLPLALLITTVLGAILMGLATPSEAAAMGSLGAILLASAYRSLSMQKVTESVLLTARTSAMVCWLFVGSAL
ncbi:MAG: TRAP transporter large permease subunit, partial [Alphaproteobacteria bacterium]|nr:TRAP transporter large permease subunit [Alphaproteobacteria bacterium]